MPMIGSCWWTLNRSETMIARPACLLVMLSSLLGAAPDALRAQEIQRSWGFVETNGTKLYYEAAGSGIPVILIHGGWLNSDQWDDQMAALSRNYRVIRYDFRGAGRSRLGDSTYAHYEDLAALIK